MKQLRTISAAIILLATAAVGQDSASDPSSSYLGVTVEGGLVSFREDLLVTLAFSGPGLALGGSFGYRSDESIVDIDLSFRIAYALNRFSHEALSLTSRLRGAWLKKVRSPGPTGELWVGASLPIRLNDMYIFSWDDAHLFWVTSYGLGPTVQWRTDVLTDAQLAVGLDLPLVHLVSRPPAYRYEKQDAMNSIWFWFTEPNKDLSFETIGTFTSLTLHGSLEWRDDDSFSSLGIEFRFTRFDGSKPIQDLNTLLTYSWRWAL